MYSNVILVEIFYFADEFCKEYDQVMRGQQLEQKSGKKHRNKPSKLNDAEVITILIAFYLGGYRNLKHFHIHYVQKHLQGYFLKTVSYNRFVELQQKALIPMILFLKTLRLGNSTGISFVDFIPIRVCKNKRIYTHKLFKGVA